MCSSPERKRSPGLSWLACWCYFPFAFAAVCDRNCRFSWPKRRRRCWKHVAGISRKLPANAVQVFRLHQVLFSWWKSLYVLPVPSVSPWFLPPCPFVANTDLTLLCRLSPPFSIILSLLPPSLFFFFLLLPLCYSLLIRSIQCRWTAAWAARAVTADQNTLFHLSLCLPLSGMQRSSGGDLCRAAGKLNYWKTR